MPLRTIVIQVGVESSWFPYQLAVQRNTTSRFASLILATALLQMLSAEHLSVRVLSSDQSQPSLETVLARAAAYVASFSRQLSGIVSEEFYIQEVRHTYPAASATRLNRRELRSDFLLVLPAGADRYVEFRDVFEVDGNPVRDRSERLTRLFLNPDANADQMRAIIDESARLNIGADIPRNINTPMLPLHFLLPVQQPRFKFRRSDRKSPNLTGYDAPRGGTARFRASTEVWVVEFEETRRGTIIRTHEGRDFPATGRFWIEPDTGTVMMTELIMDRGSVRALIDVSYESEPLLGFQGPGRDARAIPHAGPSGSTAWRGMASSGSFRCERTRPSRRRTARNANRQPSTKSWLRASRSRR